MEGTTDRKGASSGRRYFSHAGERLRVMGEMPIRKFDKVVGTLRVPSDGNGTRSVPTTMDGQPRDPDGNPDTSFLAKIPADVAFTFQTIDKRGMVLNSAQTWHQLRPGEMRTDCGGCHAHSQKPTEFRLTLASKPDYKVWDLVNSTPLVTARGADTSKQKWDAKDETGLRDVKTGPLTVEYWRDIKPILARSCVSCHTAKDGKVPEGSLNLDADDELVQHDHHGKFPGTYYRLALDEKAKFGHKPPGWDSWGYPNASRYIRKFQSRRSMLVWKMQGERLDGFSNDDHPSEDKPGSGKLMHKGAEVDLQKNKAKFDIDYTGERMPPRTIGTVPLTDEELRTIARWIDLGCPIDHDYDPAKPQAAGFGYMLDDQRPTLSMTMPLAGSNPVLSWITLGMHDYGSGLKMDSLRVVADFAIDGLAPGENQTAKFKPDSQGVWEMKLTKPIANLKRGTITATVADKQGNVTKIERTFSAGR